MRFFGETKYMLPECCRYLSTLMRGMQEGESDRPAGESRQTGEGGGKLGSVVSCLPAAASPSSRPARLSCCLLFCEESMKLVL